MGKLACCLLAIALCISTLVSQDQVSNALKGRSFDSRSQTQQGNPQTQDDKDQSKKNKKKKKDHGTDDLSTSASFSDAVAQSLLEKLVDALEGHSDRAMLSVFDDEKMEDYSTFQLQIVALFRRCDSFRVHYRMAQTTDEGRKGVALVDFEMDKLPRSSDEQPVRERDQLRFEMERGNKGWKIIEVQPRAFFN